MSNRSDIGIAVIGGTTVTGDGATIIAARGGIAIVDTGTMALCRGFTAGAAVIAIITAIIEQKGRRLTPPFSQETNHDPALPSCLDSSAAHLQHVRYGTCHALA
ncbi:MAG: hypothetical protein AB7S74_14370 [Hyphomicrobium sp.]|jgi:hypothetical protein